MRVAYELKPLLEKKQEISDLLKGYWRNDVWDIRDSFFEDLRPIKWSSSNVTADFSRFSPSIKDEVKYMYAYRLQEKDISLTTVVGYNAAFNQLAEFLNIYYPQIISFIDIPYDKALLQWRSYLVERGETISNNGTISNKHYEVAFNQLNSFYVNFYDTRDEYEKDVWDCRKIPGAKITESGSHYYLNFTDIPLAFREFVKRYIKFRTTNNSQVQCRVDIMSLRLFTKHIYLQEPSWKDLKILTRKHMENYLSWYKAYTEGWKKGHRDYISSLRIFLDYIQRAQYPEAPELPSVLLLFKEDMPKASQKTENDIKFIPE